MLGCVGWLEGGLITASEPRSTRIRVSALDRDPHSRRRARKTACLIGCALIALYAGNAFATSHHKQASQQRSRAAEVEHHKKGSAPQAKRSDKKGSAPQAKRSAATPEPSRESAIPVPKARPASADLPPDVAAAKQAIDLVRQRSADEATRLAATIDDAAVRKLVEWVLLREPESTAGFDRFAAFIRANPEWPSISLLRRRAEARLWQERRDAATVRSFTDGDPVTPAGRLALARVLFGEGDLVGAVREVRSVWRSAELSADMEAAVLDAFRDTFTPADHVVRMDRRIGAKDLGGAMRAAKRLGSDEVAIVKACSAAQAGSDKAKDQLDQVPDGVRHDLGYALCRLHWLMHTKDVAAATQLVLAVPHEELRHQDTDEWWRELRLLARRLLDLGDAKAAYQIVRKAAAPANPYYRAEFHFTPGWIALRFLGDPATALEHFEHIDEAIDDPIVRARAAYWRGRAAEAAGRLDVMRAQYQAAAQYPTAYYGQLARARIGIGEIELRHPPLGPLMRSGHEMIRAVEILYEIGERDLVRSFMADIAAGSNDCGVLAALGQLAADHNDAQAMLLLGKTALAHGLPMDPYAFPNIGVPAYSPVGPHLDRSIIYSVVRTESAFNPQDMSPAKAVGLMQVTPEAGRDTAKRFGVTYDWQRLVSDQPYNTQMGAAELAALFKEYRGSYIMTFAGYNAGRGRVQQWVAQHGDPRDPKVDAVDWVERIPIAETRNYVQRVIENLRIYGVRFGADIVTVEPNLHRPTPLGVSVAPASLDQAQSSPTN